MSRIPYVRLPFGGSLVVKAGQTHQEGRRTCGSRRMRKCYEGLLGVDRNVQGSLAELGDLGNELSDNS